MQRFDPYYNSTYKNVFLLYITKKQNFKGYFYVINI